MMSVSTFTGIDSGGGNYLKVLSPPVNVIENHEALIDIIQIDVPASMTDNADVTRDPGAAIRDAVNIFSKFNPDAADILYLVSRRYVDGGPTVKELDMIEALLESEMTLICVERTDTTDPNRMSNLNLNRITSLTEGYYFTNTETVNWLTINDAAVNQLVELSKDPINSVRHVVSPQ